jgi:hypothetical protein
MATPSGLSGQFGYRTETTPGTPVAVDKFLPVTSAAVTQDIERLDSMGLRAGRLVTATWKSGSRTISGTIEMELWNVDIATLFRHMFGAVDTTGASAPFTHTYTPGDLVGDSLTIQVGKPDIAGTVHPFTWAGCKIGSWTLSASVGEISSLSLDVVGMSETTAEPLETASYDAGLVPFCFTTASLQIGGSTVPVQNVDLTGDNGLTDRFRLGSDTSLEYLKDAFTEITGSATADFEDLTQYNRFVNGDEVALVLTWDNGTESLTITMNVRFDGASPELSGPELLEQPIEFKAISATSDAAAFTAVLGNPDESAA